MESKEHKILILEDAPADAELVERELRKGGLDFVSKLVSTKEDFLTALDTFAPDLILSDYNLPHFDGLSALALTKEKCPDVPFILVTGTIGDELAVDALRRGATDYVLKGNLIKLMLAIERAFRDADATNKLRQHTLDLEKLVNTMVQRELKMVELKKTIDELRAEIIRPK